MIKPITRIRRKSNRLSLISLSRILRAEATGVRIDKRNLLEARVIVTTYNDHVRLLSPEPWLVSATKVYSGVGADIVMESLHQLCGCFRNPLNAMASKNVLTSLIIRAKRAQVAQSVPAMLPMRL